MVYSFKNLVLFGLLALVGQHANAFAQVSSKAANFSSKKQNRRLLVKYKEHATSGAKNKAHFLAGVFTVKAYDLPKNLEVIEVVKGISVQAAAEILQEDPNVLYVEPDEILHAYFTPPPSDRPPEYPIDPPPEEGPDPKLKEQWGLDNYGQTGGTADADINAKEAWETFPLESDVIIGVIDTGINYLHPDLKANIWTNPDEIPNNGIDDDNNGVIDDIHGYNSIAQNGDPMDDEGHGSHCAGVIGAESQNNYGGRGVLPKAKIISCKFLDASGSGETSAAIACLNYLLKLKTREQNPINIIATSNSWGGASASLALQEAIQAHQDAGILFIAAAGNDGEDNDVVQAYPANYPLANIISVGATDHDDRLASFSNFGLHSVHVVAPGVDVLSTTLNNNYEKLSGTSMATPFVAGMAGFIKALIPDSDFIKIKNLIIAGGTPLAGLDGKTISGRRIRLTDINGLGSLSCKDQLVSRRLSPLNNDILLPVGEKLRLSAININCSEANGAIVIPSSPVIEDELDLQDSGEGFDSAAGDGMYTTEWVAVQPGRYEFLFPQNDLVVVTAYDTSTFEPYLYEKAEFNYKKIAGTRIEAGDDWAGVVSLPFLVKFAGYDPGFNKLTINSNGVMSFTNTEEVDFSNSSLPQGGFVSFISPWWDDLNPDPGFDDAGIYVETIGSEPNREYVVEYRNVSHFSSQKGITFQVVFFENSPEIWFNYLNTDFGDSLYDNGANATVGIQSTSDKHIQMGYNAPVLSPKTSFRFFLN